MTLLYHTYPEASGKGQSTCAFTLGEVFFKLTGGKANKNVTHEPFNEESLNQTTIETLLTKAQDRARG